MDYNPEDATQVWPAVMDGKPIAYDAELLKVEETTAKSSGNPMEVWTVKVYDPEGRSKTIVDRVVVPAATWKIKQLAAALGQQAAFQSRHFQAGDNIGAGFKVNLRIEKQDGFDDKNTVGTYIGIPPVREAITAGAAPARKPVAPQQAPPYGNEQQFKEDEIPF